MELNSDKRRFQRFIYQSNAVLDNAGVTFECKIHDLSLKGCLLEFAESWPVATQKHYTLTMDLSDDVSIVMDVQAVHVDDKFIGFSCQNIDIDSITNLRRLVELNLGNSQVLERELTALTHI